MSLAERIASFSIVNSVILPERLVKQDARVGKSRDGDPDATIAGS
jgi:hypothetical protein